MCCPYCKCTDVSNVKDKGLIEVGPHEFAQEEEHAMDIYICPECQRRFMVLDDSQ